MSRGKSPGVANSAAPGGLLAAADEFAERATLRGCAICRAGSDAHEAVGKLTARGLTRKQVAAFLAGAGIVCDGDHVHNHIVRHAERFADAQKAKPRRRG